MIKKVLVQVDVDKTLKELLSQEDTNHDLKITIDDKGPKSFLLQDHEGGFQVCGQYHLANLLQLLAYAHHNGKLTIQLSKEQIYQNPIDRFSEQIKNIYLDKLTHALDEDGIVKLLEDSKGKKDANKRIYISYRDQDQFNYYLDVSKKHPYLNLDVIRLPEKITTSYVESINEKPGILGLKIDYKNGRGFPFVVPGGRFNEMYGWDSYFIVLGLLEDKKIDLALSIIENFFYQIDHYGAILNANRSYYLMRSQPPFLSSMVLEVLKYLPSNQETFIWLKRALSYLIDEYSDLWMKTPRLSDNGLNRYLNPVEREPPEVEEGHFEEVFKKHAKLAKMSIYEFKQAYQSGKLKDEELDQYFKHDRSMRESGHDTSYRLVNKSAHLNPVDLNSLLYKYECDIAHLIQSRFNNHFEDHNNKSHTSESWHKRSVKRKSLMHKYLFDTKEGMFFDYDFKERKKHKYYSATLFYPLFANLCDKKEADQLVEKLMPIFERDGGIVSSSSDSVKEFSKSQKKRQWDHPFGWAPHQMLIWMGLKNYNFNEIAQRLIYKWLYLLTEEAMDYNGLIVEKYNVVDMTHKVDAEYGNVGEDFKYYPDGGFAWTNASYLLGLSYLDAISLKKLKEKVYINQL